MRLEAANLRVFFALACAKFNSRSDKINRAYHCLWIVEKIYESRNLTNFPDVTKGFPR